MPGPPYLSPGDLIDLFHAANVTLASGVPTIWLGMLQVLESEPGRRLPPGIQMIVGGAALPEVAARRLLLGTRCQCAGQLGMTEISPMGSLPAPRPNSRGSITGSDSAGRSWGASLCHSSSRQDHRDRRAGTPWDGVSLGELQVRGPFVAGNYHEASNESDRFTSDGFLRTGDVAAIDQHAFIRTADRTKDTDQVRWRVDQLSRYGRLQPDGSRGCPGGSGDCRSRSEVGRATARVRGAQAWAMCHRRRTACAPRLTLRPLAAPRPFRVRRYHSPYVGRQILKVKLRNCIIDLHGWPLTRW